MRESSFLIIHRCEKVFDFLEFKETNLYVFKKKKRETNLFKIMVRTFKMDTTSSFYPLMAVGINILP